MNLLEYCRRHRAGFILLSTSRVYSIAPLAALPVRVKAGAFAPDGAALPPGMGPQGISEAFPTAAPVSLYGATKLASEALALEYGEAFGIPVFVNRCGILAGAGQFGRPDQGIFSYWINSHLRRRPLQVHRIRRARATRCATACTRTTWSRSSRRRWRRRRWRPADRIVNIGGGAASAMSLLQLTAVVRRAVRPPPRRVGSGRPRLRHPLDGPGPGEGRAGLGMDAADDRSAAILEEIAAHAGTHPGWLELSAPL